MTDALFKSMRKVEATPEGQALYAARQEEALAHAMLVASDEWRQYELSQLSHEELMASPPGQRLVAAQEQLRMAAKDLYNTPEWRIHATNLRKALAYPARWEERPPKGAPNDAEEA